MPDDTQFLDRAGRQAAYIANEWSDDPAIIRAQALCYVGIQLERIADALDDDGDGAVAGADEDDGAQ